ncbi:hypothetical protein PIROE2DRAFT_3841 [Piromyces sp. E2]|nr:hypothetical protein PIROE2DRAFT_3841 [Piromyces sp. E2]|eukprot:OUM68399.1 hypothetical protein PIROE2DRAFT_3841 [Piromyces sp. E2]
MYSIYALAIFPGNAINIISAIALIIGVKKDIFILVVQYLMFGIIALAFKIQCGSINNMFLFAFAFLDIIFYIVVCCYVCNMKKEEKEKQPDSESNAVPDISVQ